MAAAVGSAARLSARLASTYSPRQAARRCFRVAAINHAATAFTMPALSPTMTEGNIAKWNVKEGDSYSAGDVLLEIETDKATMDVEAQDDGVLFKITRGDESKGVKVGQRIAVMAEQGDDLSSLEMPAEEGASSSGQPASADRPSAQEETSREIDGTESSESAAEAPPSSKTNVDAAAGSAADAADARQPAKSSGKAQRKYPLYPAVSHLLHENGMSKADADRIPASGPNGRLLKGDVLAYLGKIENDYSANQSKRLEKLGHLDLSNIQLAPPSIKTAAAIPAAPATEPELTKDIEVAMPISLSAVIATQKRVQDTLGIFLPLSTFIARASELANEDLPASKKLKPTPDELFNAVLGLKAAPRMNRCNFLPHVTGLSPTPAATPVRAARKADIIDMLAPRPPKRAAAKPAVPIGVSAGANVFSVTTPTGDEKRATKYLERMKLVLESEPGRLVL